MLLTMNVASGPNVLDMDEKNLKSEADGVYNGPPKPVMMILVGLVGSGKSTFSKALEMHFPQFRRLNQDELKDRRAYNA